MGEQPLKEILSELHSDDWLVRGIAVRKLFVFGDEATAALPRLLELTFDEKAPIQSDTCRLIKRLGASAVPFLIQQARADNPDIRARAIDLLTESGDRWRTTTRLQMQILDERKPELPEWGEHCDTVLRLLEDALSDDDLKVRYAAASALEEFGRSIPDTIPVFVEVINAGPQHGQNWAALHLGRIGPEAFIILPVWRNVIINTTERILTGPVYGSIPPNRPGNHLSRGARNVRTYKNFLPRT
jgi:HEAT repeat protein